MESVAEKTVVNVTDADFMQKVVEESKNRPVVVDLWAAWCGPCRNLGPILERVAEQRGGRFLLAKIDVDANGVGQELLRAVQSQGIPTVVAFKGGQAVDGFIGALPEEAVNEFVDRILPTAADEAAEVATEVAAGGDVEEAERGFREALEQDPKNRSARLGLARILVDRGDADAARETLMPLLPDADAERLLSQLEVASWARLSEPGTLPSAKRLAAQGRWREALDGMLGALEDDAHARQAMLEVFAVLGDDDPLVADYRRRLASSLF
jgi:putative thioredoxin